MNNDNSNPFSILKELRLENHNYDNSDPVCEEPSDIGSLDYSKIKIRVWLEKKKRKGKTVSLIKGLDLPDVNIKHIAKTLKSKLGAGGSVDGDIILIQSQNRDEIISILKSEGFDDVLKAGS
jgi:translation initiation factor 1